MSKPDAPQSVTVRLLKPHTHADAQKDAGDTLELSPDQAAWLKAEGVAEILPTAATK